MYPFKLTGSILGALASLGLCLFLLLGFSPRGVASQASAPPWTTGGIQPVQAPPLIDGMAPNRQLLPPNLPGQIDILGLILTATVGLDPHQCASTPIIHVPSGTQATFCYYIYNSGTDPIDFHSLSDDRIGILVPPTPFLMPPGSSAFVTVTTAISQTARAEGTWSGLNEAGDVLVSASDAAKIYVNELRIAPGLGAADGPCEPTSILAVAVGSTVTECHRLINNTDLLINRHSVRLGDSGQGVDNLFYELQPGAELSLIDLGLSVTHVMTTSLGSTIEWEATFDQLPADMGGELLGSPIALSRQAAFSIAVPALSFTYGIGLDRQECSANDTVTVFAGAEVVLCYFATNTGGITLTHHQMLDTFTGTERTIFDGIPYVIPPGASALFTETQTALTTTTASGRWAGFTADPKGNSVSILSAQASDQITVNVRELGRAQVIIYSDLDEDGQQDADEMGIPNALVDLVDRSNKLFSQRTDTNGVAIFTNLPPGFYEISVRFNFTQYEPVGSGDFPQLLARSGETTSMRLAFMPSSATIRQIYLPFLSNTD